MHIYNNVIWSARARTDFRENIQYLYDNWSEKEVVKFVKQVRSAIRHIRTFPLGFPASKKKPGVRMYVLSKIHSIYYQINEDNTIELLTIFDNRQRKLNL
jgi:plasmid stabilization system protein ParE